MDILEAVSGIHIIYQIVCLSPCLIDRKAWTLRRSRLLETYIIIVLMGSVIFMLFSLFTEYNFINISNNVLAKTVSLIQLVGIQVSHIASITGGLIKSKEQTRFYQEVKIVDRIFERSFNVDVNNKKFRRTTILHALLTAFVYLAAKFFILVSVLLYEKTNLLLFWLWHLMPLLVCGIRYFQMFTSVRIVNYRFDLLVNVLNRINLNQQKYETNDMDSKDNVEVPPNFKHNLALLQSSLIKKSSCDMENPELKRLLIVRDVYNRLYNLSEILNCHFGVSMLINVGNDFISITSNCYWIFYNFQDFYLTRNDFLQIITSFVWSLPHLMNIVILAVLCEKTVQKAKKMALVLHGINIDYWNDNHNTVIEQFSLQLLHQKIFITAAGFFSIDFPLLYTIVGSITTYLIILIQFQINESESSK